MLSKAIYVLILSGLLYCEACSFWDTTQCYRSCEEMKLKEPTATTKMYKIRDDNGHIYRTYCDMDSAGGGWTLVASVHEDHLGGKCTKHDRWSGQLGNKEDGGGRNWENKNTFGTVAWATRDDFKNAGYSNLNATNVMIWHVPNRTPVNKYSTDAFMMYYTFDNFLSKYGGNLYTLFKTHFPIKGGVFEKYKDNGPSPPVDWIRGNNALRVAHTPPKMRPETTPGYIQFRAINTEGGAFALCPGLRMGHRKTPGLNAEHVCIGGSSPQKLLSHCGDFSAFDHDGYGTGVGWSADLAMTESTVLIFYR